uniref:Uncharacterized protein n=1 Tax=Theileria annulata TaxID=5874 RepID=A0A3B0MTL1_THEAN
MVIGSMDTTYPKKDKATEIPKGNVTITYGDCPPKTDAKNNGTANINTPENAGPTLTITGVEPKTEAPLEETGATPLNCTVSVDTTKKTLTIKYDGDKCIEITLTGSDSITKTATPVQYGHILTETFDMSKVHPHIVSPTLMVIVGMVLLVMTIFPPVIVAVLRISFDFGDPKSPMCEWDSKGFYGAGSGLHWHAFDLLMIIKISLAYLFIYWLHHRDYVDLLIRNDEPWRR